MDTNWEKEERQVKNLLVEEREIGSCVACVYRIMDARLKFKEERKYQSCARRSSSFLTALIQLQTSQFDARTGHSMNKLFNSRDSNLGA